MCQEAVVFTKRIYLRGSELRWMLNFWDETLELSSLILRNAESLWSCGLTASKTLPGYQWCLLQIYTKQNGIIEYQIGN